MKRLFALALLALFFSGASAGAAPENEMISGTTFSSDPALGVQQLHEFADCAADRYSKVARHWINLPEKEASASVGEFTTDTFECTRGLIAVRTNAPFLRGAVAEALYLRATKRSSDGGALQASLHQLNFGSDDHRQLSLCVAQRDFVKSDLFLKTYPATNREGAAFEALAPVIRACASDLKVGIPAQPMFRAALADVLYSAVSQIRSEGPQK